MISVIHNTYKHNPFIRESVILNLKALKDSGVEYQYIVFNDNGDLSIEELVSDLPVLYYYSDFNFGMKICSGGWVGALPLVKGDLIHNTGQDDVFTSHFYKTTQQTFDTKNCDLVYCNGLKVKDDLSFTGELMGPLEGGWNYNNPREVFNAWFGVTNGKITRANNYIPAPGTVYKKKLHEEIGEPDLNNFGGVADFEYWSRVLFYKKHVEYIHMPCWLYRLSEFSTTNVVVDGKLNDRDLSPLFVEKMKQKYQELLNNE